MSKTAFFVLAAIAFTSWSGATSAQQIYIGPNPGYAPAPGYGPGYGPPPGYGPGYGPSPGYDPGYGPPGPYYRGYREGRGGGYYPPGRFRTWNGCQGGWTVQDGLCKPYRGR
jgi:hypothetical protein